MSRRCRIRDSSASSARTRRKVQASRKRATARASVSPRSATFTISKPARRHDRNQFHRLRHRAISLHQFDLAYMEASIGPRLALDPVNWPGVTIKPYAIGNVSWVGGTSYLNSGGAGVSARHRHGAGLVGRAGFRVAPYLGSQSRRHSDHRAGNGRFSFLLNCGELTASPISSPCKCSQFIRVQTPSTLGKASTRVA